MTYLGTQLDMALSVTNFRLAPNMRTRRNMTEAPPLKPTEEAGHPAAPDNNQMANCQGPLRDVIQVKDMFVFGATGMTDGVTVE